jgi:putative dehydrogenase
MRDQEEGAMTQQTVGMIGLGIMGSAMSYNLVRAGLRVVGYDVAPGARAGHKRAGGVATGSPRAVAKRCDVIITSLPSARALADVAAQLAKSAKRGTVVVETSTLPIEVKAAARDVLAKRGVTLLDCPLSGTGAQARNKDLLIYVSGERAAYSRIAPVLPGFTSAAYYVGPFGAGSKMKFVANLLVAIHNVAAAEAMVLGMKARPGDDPESGRRRRRRVTHVPGARPDDGEGQLFRGDDEERGVAEGHDHHRRLCAQPRLPDAALRGERAHL